MQQMKDVAFLRESEIEVEKLREALNDRHERREEIQELLDEIASEKRNLLNEARTLNKKLTEIETNLRDIDNLLTDRYHHNGLAADTQKYNQIIAEINVDRNELKMPPLPAIPDQQN